VIVTQVQNPAIWEMPFVKRAFKAMPTAPEDFDMEAVLDRYEVWMAFDDTLTPRVLGILALSNGPLCPMPSIVHFYSEQGGPLRRALIDALVGRMKEAGHKLCLVGNWSGRNDTAWARLLRRGVPHKRVGSTFIFEVQ
jgi:hypothetical protein